MLCLLALLAFCVETCNAQTQCNPGDLNYDGYTDTADMLLFLAYFDCQEPDAPYIVPAWQNYTQDIFGGGNGFDLLVQVNDSISFDQIIDQCEIEWTVGANSVYMEDLKFQSLVYPDGMPLDCDGFFECTLSITYQGCTYSRTMVSHATYNGQSPYDPPPCENDYTLADYEAAYDQMINGPHTDVSVDCVE